MATYMLSSLIKQLLKDKGMDDTLQEARIREAWKTHIGEPIASSVEVVGYYRGELSLKTESSSWRSELKYRERSIIDSLNSVLGEKLVYRLKIK